MRAYRHGINVLFIAGLLIMGAQGADASAPAQQGGTLDYDTLVHGQISESGGDDPWTFNGQSRDLILIDMRATSPGLDTSLTLMGPDGTQLIMDDDSGSGFNARIGPYELPSEGTYTILAGHYSGQGSYTLELRYLRTIPALAPDKPLVGAVNSDQPNNFFSLDLPADAGTDVLWRLDIADDQLYSNPMITLYGPGGLITTTEGQIDTSILEPIIPVPGEDYIIAVSWDANGPGGAYEITLRQSTLELLTNGANQSGTLDSATSNQMHYFRATEGQAIRVSVHTRDAIAPALEIRSVDYSAYLFFNEGDKTREMQITLTIPVTAIYVITVRDGSFAGNQGSYTLDFEVVGE